MRVKNLTGSPYELIDKDGKRVMIPAFGTVEIDPHPMHIGQYKQIGYFDIIESEKVEKKEEPKKPVKKQKKD